VNVTGGTGSYTYLWAPSGGTAATASGLAAGTYTVTVTDANQCQTTQSFTITGPASALAASITAQTNVLCNGSATGSATVTASGGAPGYTYSWNTTPVQTTATASGLAAGVYTVTVTDANNITTTADVTIIQPAALAATSGGQTNVSAFGASNGSATVNVTGGTGSYTYLWAPSGGTAATASGLAAGTYTVTVTDANQCQTTQSFTITGPASALTAAITAQTNVLCNGSATGSATVTASGGAGGYTYSWNTTPVQTTATASGLAAGVYTVTVTDANNIITTAQATITQPAALSATTTAQPSLSCSGTASGSATVVASGGTGTYTYSWNTSPVQTTATATGLPAGSYTVTVTDASGCSTTAQAVVSAQDNTPTLTRQSSVHPTLCGGSNGSILFATTHVANGTYTLNFKKNGADTSASVTVHSQAFSLEALPAAAYSAFYLDAGCPGSLAEIITLSDPAALTAVITPTGATELCEDETVVLTATQADSYHWSTGDTTRSITADKGGLYSVTITSAQGCSSQAQIIVTEKICNVAPMAVCKPHVVLVAKENCYATLRPEDLDAGSYDNNNDWFNRSMDIQPDLTVGTYTVTFSVVDIRGASTSCQSRVEVVDHTPPVALARGLTLALDPTGNAYFSTADVDAGSHDNCGPVTLTLNRTHFDCSALGHHQVILTVTDASGNTATALADITVVDNQAPVVKTRAVTLALDETGSATLEAEQLAEVISDNCGIWNLRLSQTRFSCEDLGMNRVVITVEDVQGNTVSDTVEVMVTDAAPPVITARPAVLYLDAAGSATLDATLIGLTATDNCGIDSLQISRTHFTCEDLGGHTVRITATDRNGNTADTTLTVTVADTLAPVVRVQEVMLYLDASGQALLTAEQADNGSTDNCGILSRELDRSRFDCASVGQHTVTYTLTDAAGNRTEDIVTVTVRDTAAPVARAQNIILELSDAGVASLTPQQADNGSSDNCAIASMTLSQTLFGCEDLGSRLVTLTVTDSHGNPATAKSEVLIRDPQGICPCSYGVLATDRIVLRSNEVFAGGIGVTSAKGKAKLRKTEVNREGTFVKAPHTRFDDESESSVYFRGQAPQPEAFRKNTGKDKGKEKIGKGGSKTLGAGRYGKIKAGKGATLTFSGGEVYIRSLKVKKNAKVNFSEPAVLLVRKQFTLASATELNSSGESVRVYAGRRIRIGNGAEIKGYLHTQGLLSTSGGSEETRLEGFFAAERIRAARNTQWSGGGVLCRENEQIPQSISKERRKARVAAEEEDREEETEAPQIRLSISPNPAADKVRAEVFCPSGNGELTLTDIFGNVLLKRSIQSAGSVQEIDIKAFTPGTYIVRLTDGKYTKTLRLIKEKL